MFREHVVKGERLGGAAVTLRLTQMAMLTAIAVVLIIFVRIPLIPAASYLVYDMADVPILLGAFMFGPASGMLILVLVSAIQTLFLDGAAHGIIGFIMHVSASGTLVLVSSLLFRRLGDSNRNIAVSLIAGGLAMAVLMIPLNLFFTPILFGMPMKAVAELIIPVLLPFNLLKAVLTGLTFFLLYKSLRAIMKK